MPAQTFHFKEFSVQQDKCAMKVGTDGVLLGSWVKPADARMILDIGTGTGLIALMLAQRSNAIVDAVEIHPDAYEQAQQNALMSQWADRIRVFHDSFQRFARRSDAKYDLIVSNPPYFNCPAPKQKLSREIARHLNTTISMDELLQGVTKRLSDDGCFYLIMPVREGKVFVEKAEGYGLHCNKRCSIHTTAAKTPKRWMMQFSTARTLVKEETLIIQDGDQRFTEEYVELTSDYYLGLREFRN